MSTDNDDSWPGTFVLEQRAQHAYDMLFWKLIAFCVLLCFNAILWLT